MRNSKLAVNLFSVFPHKVRVLTVYEIPCVLFSCVNQLISLLRWAAFRTKINTPYIYEIGSIHITSNHCRLLLISATEVFINCCVLYSLIMTNFCIDAVYSGWMRMLIITSVLFWGYVIVGVCPSVSLFVCKQRNSKPYSPLPILRPA